MAEAQASVRVVHVYDHDPSLFEDTLNDVLARIQKEGGVIDEIEYSTDPQTDKNRGGFGALVIYEVADAR